MRTRVATLGGSLLRPEVEDRHEWLIELCKAVNDVISSGYKLALVIGGGAPAREGIELARPILNTNTEALDRIGIAATRLNATIVAEALIDTNMSAEEIALKSLNIAAEICVYTNNNITVEKIEY